MDDNLLAKYSETIKKLSPFCTYTITRIGDDMEDELDFKTFGDKILDNIERIIDIATETIENGLTMDNIQNLPEFLKVIYDISDDFEKSQ